MYVQPSVTVGGLYTSAQLAVVYFFLTINVIERLDYYSLKVKAIIVLMVGRGEKNFLIMLVTLGMSYYPYG